MAKPPPSSRMTPHCMSRCTVFQSSNAGAGPGGFGSAVQATWHDSLEIIIYTDRHNGIKILLWQFWGISPSSMMTHFRLLNSDVLCMYSVSRCFETGRSLCTDKAFSSKTMTVEFMPKVSNPLISKMLVHAIWQGPWMHSNYTSRGFSLFSLISLQILVALYLSL